jgi:hypothetical protein
MKLKPFPWFSSGLALALVVLWAFPWFWYAKPDFSKGIFWLAEKAQVPGWEHKPIPLYETAERALAADVLTSAEYTQKGGAVVRVFAANRYTERQNDIGLFVHTPDRCWTEAGWKLEPVAPDFVELTVHGHQLAFERRLFLGSDRRELVYFGGLVAGEPLPYRLDHNLSVGAKTAARQLTDQSGTAARASSRLFWRRVWDSFASRKPLLGPKQFLRLSTPIQGNELAAADRLLAEFLPQWLAPCDYAQERAAWQASRKSNQARR